MSFCSDCFIDLSNIEDQGQSFTGRFAENGFSIKFFIKERNRCGVFEIKVKSDDFVFFHLHVVMLPFSRREFLRFVLVLNCGAIFIGTEMVAAQVATRVRPTNFVVHTQRVCYAVVFAHLIAGLRRLLPLSNRSVECVKRLSFDNKKRTWSADPGRAFWHPIISFRRQHPIISISKWSLWQFSFHSCRFSAAFNEIVFIFFLHFAIVFQPNNDYSPFTLSRHPTVTSV